MKPNYKIAILILTCGVSMSFSSCTNLLDEKPYGQFTSGQIDDASIEGLMAAAYAGLEAHFFGNNESFTAPATNWVFDVRSDDAYKGGGGVSMEASIHQLEISNLTSDNPTAVNKWKNNYFAISRIHKAMNAVRDANIAKKDELMAELRLLRAHFYFDLIRIFERIPYLTEDSDPSTVTNKEFTREQIFDKLKDDLQFAWDNLPENQPSVGRFNKYVAAAYMAKVALETRDWAKTVEFADYVIGSSKYALYDNYLDMSKIEFNNQKESVMAIQFSTANNNAHINWGNLLNTTYSDGNLFGSGDDFFLGSQNLVNAFRTDENGLPYPDNFNEVNVTASYTGNVDPRLDFTVGRIGIPFRGHTYNERWCRAYDIYGEYSGKKGMIDPASADMVQGFPWGASSLNYSIIRYADVLLWKAEALIESNQNPDGARTIINDIRAKAKRSVDAGYAPVDVDPVRVSYKIETYPATGWTQEYARKALRMERRLELALEGHRWFDLVRWGEAVQVVNKYMREEETLRPYYQDGTISENEIYLPVPKDEVENSGGLYD
ncbi:RagB/SusD family nutrient uptake outer membrane protein [Bacteroides sp. UBA939]|uniref:RagB/SusD family nutrient uptake outer membrane protein n=1 Tax=Bacteroides sp. UBA939 TaxID=1946092 RepID=UPI0025C61E18|nr:RagB/SusD family nutrient uptake outer membrane protein [Bacteroides sp. UBA939]